MGFFILLGLGSAGCEEKASCPPFTPYPEWIRQEQALDISDDSHLIVCARGASVDGPLGIYILDRSHGREFQFVKPYSPTEDSHRLSPDGTRLCYTDGDVRVFDRNSGHTTRLTFTNGNAFYPDWDPTGRFIAYSMTARPRGVPDSLLGSFIIDTATSRQRRLSEQGVSIFTPGLSWSPDGRYLAYEEDRAIGGMNVRLFDLETQGPSRALVVGVGVNQVLRVMGWNGSSHIFVRAYDSQYNCHQTLSVDIGTQSRQPSPVPLAPNGYAAALSRNGQWMCYVDLDSAAFQGVLYVQRTDDVVGATRQQVSSFTPPGAGSPP